MAEYIERDAAMLMPVLPKEYRQYQTENLDDAYEQGWLDATGNLKNVPAADVAPVKRARWNRIKHPYCFCTNCACAVKAKKITKYCPECGARMDGEE